MSDKGSLHKVRVAAIILAAGASIRMGQPKLLLQWKGKPLVHYPLTAAIQAGLDPVLLVTGKFHAEIVSAITGSQVTVVQNEEWEQGQSTSIKKALLALPNSVNAVVFLLGDQPLVPASSIVSLVSHYRQSEPHPIITAASVMGKRANPVLIDRSVFPELLQLSGDAGARQLFVKYPPVLVEMDEPGLLFDVDSPDDYQKLILK